jgi:hypothetical protein
MFITMAANKSGVCFLTCGALLKNSCIVTGTDGVFCDCEVLCASEAGVREVILCSLFLHRALGIDIVSGGIYQIDATVSEAQLLELF